MTPEARRNAPLRPTLESLPYDLLHAIVTHLPSAHSLASLSATSRTLHRFCTKDGWRIFLITHFPSLYPSLACKYGDPRDPTLCLAHTKRLTLLLRNHHRRAFSAHRLPAGSTPPSAPRRRRRSSNAQTLGFRPALAASDDALFVAAGPELVFHNQPGQTFRTQRFGTAGHDDILTTALLPSGALIGQANGKLSHIHIPSSRVSWSYDTGHRTVRSISVAPDDTSFSATLCGSRSAIRVYSTSDYQTNGFTDLDLSSSIPLWTSAFLSPRSLLAATTSSSPVRVFDLAQNTETRAFLSDTDTASASCVFCLSPIPASTATFLAGWFSGATRLHDVRAPEEHVVELHDPLDAGSAIYSLLPLDEHRVIVGGARNARVKSFDMRMPSHGWGMYLPVPIATGPGNRGAGKKAGAVYALAQIGVGGERVFAGVEGGVWQLDFSEGLGGSRPRGREESPLMYEWGTEVKLWKRREGGAGGGGELDEKWKRVTAERGRDGPGVWR